MKMAKRLEIALKDAKNFSVFVNIDEYKFWDIAPVFTAGGVSILGAESREKYPRDFSKKEIRRWNNGEKNAYINALSRRLVAHMGGKYARELLARFEQVD